MELKEMEELAQNNYILQIYIISCFMNYQGINYWNSFTEEEKLNLIGSAEYYYLKDCSGASVGIICDLCMEHQKEILNDTMIKSEFFDLLCDKMCDY